MKLWDKGFEVNEKVEKFTVGNDRVLDLKLAKYDVLGNIAHAKMLKEIGILTDEELKNLILELEKILVTIEKGEFVIEENFEDVHSKIEFELTKSLGEVGKKIHSARSRNDQVLVDLHLYVKDELKSIKNLVKTFFNLLIEKSEKHKNHLMPGYTHLQIAMPSSFGLWFGAYAEILIDDLILLNAAFTIADQNPLGSAAGYGSSFPIKRHLTTQLLGFKTMKFNVVASQMSRGKLEKTTAFALASLASTLSKWASDVCLFMCQNFNFLSLPKNLTTGSSIMPHKQNPDVFELMRAKCNKIQALPNEITLLTNNLTSGYFRDLQLLKESLISGIEQIKECLTLAEIMLQNLIVNEDILQNSMYDPIYSVEEVNKLVLEGVSFREAYKIIGQKVMNNDFEPNKNIKHTHEGSLGNLCLKEIKEKFEANFSK